MGIDFKAAFSTTWLTLKKVALFPIEILKGKKFQDAFTNIKDVMIPGGGSFFKGIKGGITTILLLAIVIIILGLIFWKRIEKTLVG